MTYNELTRKLKKKGCKFLKHGGSHDFYMNPATGGITQILRHWTQQVNAGTLKSILNDLGLESI